MSAATSATRAIHGAQRRHSAPFRDLRADRRPNEAHYGPLSLANHRGLWDAAQIGLPAVWPPRRCTHVARWKPPRPRRRWTMVWVPEIWPDHRAPAAPSTSRSKCWVR